MDFDLLVSGMKQRRMVLKRESSALEQRWSLSPRMKAMIQSLMKK